ncbi:arylsulfatase, partial [bacterium]|nr:arylsulfatase [bacterium]
GAKQGSSWEFVEDCLYDLLADPYELNNLIEYTSFREVSEVMKVRLIRRMTQAGEPEPNIHPRAGTIPGGQKEVYPEELHQ